MIFIEIQVLLTFMHRFITSLSSEPAKAIGIHEEFLQCQAITRNKCIADRVISCHGDTRQCFDSGVSFSACKGVITRAINLMIFCIHICPYNYNCVSLSCGTFAGKH